MIENLATRIPVIDESVYHEPYVVKDGCLCERKIVRQQEIELKLADFVPVLKAVITLDDGIEQKKLFRVSAAYKTGMDAALSEVRKLCAELGESFTVKKNELLKQLRKEGLIVSRTSRNTISIRDNGGKGINVAMLDKQKINKRLSRDLCPQGGEAGETAEQ